VVAFTLVSRDAKDGVAAVPGALDELAGEGVIAVIGPADKDAARAAGERAAALGLPVISLDVGDEDPTASPLVFRVVVPVEQRARALARAAFQQGARDFAVLAPSMTYGARATAAFADEVQKLGGKVIVTVNYSKDATSFVDPVKKIAGVPFDALFVPDTAARLELVAPQLAVANLTVQPLGARKPKRGRGIALLSTAEALTPAFLRGSARYADGALLAPGFYADDAHPRVGPYVKRFRAAFGSDPTYLDAYAFDAALAVATVVTGGAATRAQVAEGLARATVLGVTGDVRFDAGHGRADTGFVYQVVSEAAGPAIRVLGVRVPVK
jgi:ABC-type branched-subunit amino acid transport system substrate-binding protein